jgi:hypothetical protein
MRNFLLASGGATALALAAFISQAAATPRRHHRPNRGPDPHPAKHRPGKQRRSAPGRHRLTEIPGRGENS